MVKFMPGKILKMDGLIILEQKGLIEFVAGKSKRIYYKVVIERSD